MSMFENFDNTDSSYIPNNRYKELPKPIKLNNVEEWNRFGQFFGLLIHLGDLVDFNIDLEKLLNNWIEFRNEDKSYKEYDDEYFTDKTLTLKIYSFRGDLELDKSFSLDSKTITISTDILNLKENTYNFNLILSGENFSKTLFKDNLQLTIL